MVAAIREGRLTMMEVLREARPVDVTGKNVFCEIIVISEGTLFKCERMSLAPK
jgi:hypothetical protein